MSFSNSGGGTLTLPSPTHPNHIDVQAAVRSLRRSISRSPSKFHLARTASMGSDASASSANSPNSPSPASPSLRRMASQQFGAFNSQNNAPTTQSLLAQTPLATPFRPSAKLSLRSAKSASKSAGGSSPAFAPRSATRNRTSPKSPSKRALSVASPSAGNSTPCPTEFDIVPGQENSNIFRARSPAPRRSFEKTKSRHSMHLDMSGASLQAISRFGESSTPSATASPLKRSDATLNLDQSTFGSPKAKRRSYGPSSFAENFSIFDHGPTSPSNDINDESSREYGWTGSGNKNPSDSPISTTPSGMPRRSGSLRHSTLQQRKQRSWGRRHAAEHLSHLANSEGSPVTTPVKEQRPRLSLDHYMPPPQRESPFNIPAPLPNPSSHAMGLQPRPAHQPHPLSRTITTSSSNSSIPDESPTHFPVISEKPRAPMNWSKSLPPGALRPTAEDDAPISGSVSTPDYKAAKPFFGAFASTGLVSKMNRNPELEPVGPRGTAAVPDTPCKRQANIFATYPPIPASNIKPRGGRNIRHTFGAPSTPFNAMGEPSQAPNTFGNQSGRPGLFSSFGGKHARKGSLLSLYSDDGRSPIDLNGDSQMTSDVDVPPTPTKQQLLSQTPSNLDLLTNDSPTANRHIIAPVSALGKGSWQQDAAPSCKYSPHPGPCDDGQVGVAVVPSGSPPDSNTPVVKGPVPPIAISLPSFRRTRAKRGSFSIPAPLKTRAMSSIEKSYKEFEFAKNNPVSASPLERLEFGDKASPRTPLDNDTLDVAPDASRLSISNPNESFLFPTSSGKVSNLPPATPTARHDTFSLFQDRRAITPTNGLAAHQVDASLLSRFGKVDFIGQGEFSQVYRVVDVAKPTAIQPPSFFSTPTHRTPPSPTSDKIFAVKKLKLPLKGSQDRAMRLREITALDAMRGCDHVLQLISHWEEQNNLYIQTEYCEEGSLDVFLADVGLRGRLDDFRIWKIMLELGQGLQHIHNAGFVHLDLKPSNILIDFEGTLKIGDFGMAAALPVEKGPDFEGDREYLAYEVLRGEIDKPADVFSLGLIMLEIAANVKLPDNGATWTALRTGDFSEVPALTPDANAVLRDATGMPIEVTDRSVGVMSEDGTLSRQPRRANIFRGRRQSGDIFGLARKHELLEPPTFMREATDPSSLDNVVKCMLTAEPICRPSITKVLELDSLHWVASRQRAGATVFEGNWGPADEEYEPVSLDTEMTDV
ncbi:hypothetical protein JX265_006938 [Neoarthrinium moseri]|uniref:Protein kinase domain-containing protein n=1 Tax=Neoarthrinium moseri TaxID=1658444 RepID=A0A9Q0AQ30_9PEZI|nr:hypothetical protein JX265_006938 [Neoarthrinium moseri]